MNALRSVVGENGRDPPILQDLDEGERRLFRAMRKKMEQGSQVKFKTDHNGELIAIEEVLHRASDFAPDGE